jgi:hypothetical protein
LLIGAVATADSKVVRVAGTLHLVRPASASLQWEAATMQDGEIVSTVAGRPEVPLIARNKPEISLSPLKELFGGTHVGRSFVYTDKTACQPLAISPNGVNGACLRVDGHGTLTLFRVADPVNTQRNTAVTVGEYSRLMMGFLSDDRLAVVADDLSCPFFRRADRGYADEPQARVKVLDMSGAAVATGPCVHGVVVGDGRMAYLQHDSNEKPLYSLDGQTWSPGTPATFDGRGALLIIGGNFDLTDTSGRLVAHDVAEAYWTK